MPVFDGERQNIVGILYSKDLILVDPDDEIEIGAVLSLRCVSACHDPAGCVTHWVQWVS